MKNSIFIPIACLLIGFTSGMLFKLYQIHTYKEELLEEKFEKLRYLNELYKTKDLIEERQQFKQIDSLIAIQQKEVLTDAIRQ